MAVYDIDRKETRTVISSGPFSASFRHDELLLGFDLGVVLDAARARDYAEFVIVAAAALERFIKERETDG